jgi:hypothetical protein
MQPDRLIHGQEVVKSIRPRGPNAQAEIDLGERFDSDSHGPMILKSAS